jgi:hypothetical protein
VLILTKRFSDKEIGAPRRHVPDNGSFLTPYNVTFFLISRFVRSPEIKKKSTRRLLTIVSLLTRNKINIISRSSVRWCKSEVAFIRLITCFTVNLVNTANISHRKDGEKNAERFVKNKAIIRFRSVFWHRPDDGGSTYL